MTSRVTLHELQALLDEHAFIRYYAPRVTTAEDGCVRMVIPYREDFLRPGGAVNGPLFMFAGDVGMWLAMMTLTGLEPLAVTIEMKTMFMNAAREPVDIVCDTRILKLGRRVVFGMAECGNGAGRMYAHSTITYARGVAG